MKQIALPVALALALPLALTACIGPFARIAPYAYDKKGDLVEFNYAWSAEVSADPRLRRILKADLERSFSATAAAAEADRAASAAAGRPFHSHQYNRRWTTAGQSPRLLSLDGRLMAFTGGAHPDHAATGLLWDRYARASIKPDRLFVNASSLGTLVRAPSCAMLASERTRRLGDAPASDGMAAPCPTAGVAVIPSDANHNRRFDHIRVVAVNGVAGPNVEGTYDLSVPVTANMLAAIKPLYRSGFEVAQPQ
jgi:hypothetical protein